MKQVLHKLILQGFMILIALLPHLCNQIKDYKIINLLKY